MVPSAEKTILYLTFDVVEAVKGLPLKNSVSMSLGAMRPTGAARSIPVLMRRTAALPANDPRIDCLPIPINYAFTYSIGVKPSIFKVCKGFRDPCPGGDTRWCLFTINFLDI